MLIFQQLQQLLLLQRESSWFSCSASGFLLLGKLAGYVFACTYLNVKESELLLCNYLGISPHVLNRLYSLMEKGQPFPEAWTFGLGQEKVVMHDVWTYELRNEPTGGTRRESNSKLPVQLPRVESAGPWLSAKSQQRVKLMSKLVASFGRRSSI